MSNRYLYYNGKNGGGLEHLTIHLRVLLSEAFLLNRIPIVPIFHLTPAHNKGMEINGYLNRYYNLSQIEVEGKPMEVILGSDISIPEHSDKTLSVGVEQAITTKQNQQFEFIIRNIRGFWLYKFQAIYSQNTLAITIPVSEKILNVAADANKILKNYNAIHIRRGDQLNINFLLNYYTSPRIIAKKLAKIIPPQSVLYLMSDENELDFFAKLGQYYKVKRWFDLPPVKIAAAEFANDNYFLYAIEKTIWNNADIKINNFGMFDADYKLYPNFLSKFFKHSRNLRKLNRRFLLFFYHIKPIKFVFRNLFRRGKIYD